MTSLSRFKGRKTLNKWILSYVIVMIIPILIFGYLFFKSSNNSINAQTLNSNTAEAKRISQIIDDRLDQIKKLGIQYSTSFLIQRFVDSIGTSGRELTIDEMAYIREELGNKIVANDLIVDVSLLFIKTDKALSNYGRDSLSDFFLYNNRFEGNYTEAILNNLGNYHYFTLLDETEVSVFKKKHHVIPVLQSLGYSLKPKAAVMVLLDADYLRKLISAMQLNSNNYFMIINDENESIIASSPTTDIHKSDVDAMLDKHHYESGTLVSGNNLNVYVLKSSLSNWKYIYAFNNDQVSLNNRDVFRYILISALLAFLLGFIISAFFIFHNYVPLNRLLMNAVKVSSAGNSVRGSRGTNEFDIIEKSIDNLIKVKNNVENKMKSYEPVVRKNLLVQILRGSFSGNHELRVQLNQAGLQAEENSLYGLIGMVLQSDNISAEEGSYKKSLESLVKAMFYIESYLEHHQYKAQVVEMENRRIVVILCFNSKDEAVVEEEIKQIALEIKNMIHGILKCTLYVTFSEIDREETGISRSYLKVEEMLEWMTFTGSSEFMDKAGYLENRNNFYFYPMDWEVQMTIALKTANSVLAGKILNEIKQENFKNRALSQDTLKRLSLELVETGMKVADELKLDLLRDEIEFKRMFKAAVHTEAWNYIEQFYLDICREISIHKNRSHSITDIDLVQYVENQYNNPNLSLKELSEHFGSSISRISRHFKDVTGYNFLDYINRKRILKAQELLEAKDDEIYLISEMVGYSNYSTFSRVFAKYTGVSPQEYKNSKKLQAD